MNALSSISKFTQESFALSLCALSLELFCSARLGSVIADYLTTPSTEPKKSLNEVPFLVITILIAAKSTSYFYESHFTNIGIITTIFFASAARTLLQKFRALENEVEEANEEYAFHNQQYMQLNKRHADINAEFDRVLDTQNALLNAAYLDLAIPQRSPL